MTRKIFNQYMALIEVFDSDLVDTFSERFFNVFYHSVVGTYEQILTEQVYTVEMNYMRCSLITKTNCFSIEPNSKRTAIPFSYRQKPGDCDETRDEEIVLPEPNGQSTSKDKLENIVATITVPANIQKRVDAFCMDSDKVDNEQLQTESQKPDNLD